MSDREDSGEEFTEFADLSSKAAADFDLSLIQYDQSQISYSDIRPIQHTTLLLTFNWKLHYLNIDRVWTKKTYRIHASRDTWVVVYREC